MAVKVLRLISARLLLPVMAVLPAALPSASASLIASESFWTANNGGDYPEGAFNTLTGVAGTTGFSGTTWASGTSTIIVTDDVQTADSGGLNHSLLVGTDRAGAVNFRISHPRNAHRDVSATVPVAASYYLSGLVRANAANPFSVDLDYMALGFLNENTALPNAGTDINSGIHLGMRRNDALGGLRLTAFGAGQFFDLGPALADIDYLIALELQVDPGGLDTLNAWAAADGAALSSVLSGQTLESFSGVGDIGQFAVQASFGNTNQSPRAWGDEIRLGTSLSDVVHIPEPSSLSLLATALFLLGGRRAFQLK